MKRAQIIEKLRDNAETMRGMGATALYLFGSVARNESAAGSDIDLFIDYDENSRFSLLDLVGIKQKRSLRKLTSPRATACIRC